MLKKPQPGMKVVVNPVLEPPDDPYIFQFQHSGVISSVAIGGCMIRLHSAVGEWGPIPIDRLEVDKSDWLTGDWH